MSLIPTSASCLRSSDRPLGITSWLHSSLNGEQQSVLTMLWVMNAVVSMTTPLISKKMCIGGYSGYCYLLHVPGTCTLVPQVSLKLL